MTADFEWPATRRVIYGGKRDGGPGDGAMFVPACEKCGRYVTPRKEVTFDSNGQPVGPTADCSKCGPTTMPFEGYP